MLRSSVDANVSFAPITISLSLNPSPQGGGKHSFYKSRNFENIEKILEHLMQASI